MKAKHKRNPTVITAGFDSSSSPKNASNHATAVDDELAEDDAYYAAKKKARKAAKKNKKAKADADEGFVFEVRNIDYETETERI